MSFICQNLVKCNYRFIPLLLHLGLEEKQLFFHVFLYFFPPFWLLHVIWSWARIRSELQFQMRQHWILNPGSWARDQTCVQHCCAAAGTPILCFGMITWFDMSSKVPEVDLLFALQPLFHTFKVNITVNINMKYQIIKYKFQYTRLLIL